MVWAVPTPSNETVPPSTGWVTEMMPREVPNRSTSLATTL